MYSAYSNPYDEEPEDDESDDSASVKSDDIVWVALVCICAISSCKREI